MEAFNRPIQTTLDQMRSTSPRKRFDEVRCRRHILMTAEHARKLRKTRDSDDYCYESLNEENSKVFCKEK